MTNVISHLKVRAKALKADLVALTIAIRDPKTPRLAKALAVCVVAYALSPIDLIPDFIPVIGYLDDLILVPAGITLVLRMIPPEVMMRAREEAAAKPGQPTSIFGAIAIVCIWLVLAGWLGYRLYLWLR